MKANSRNRKTKNSKTEAVGRISTIELLAQDEFLERYKIKKDLFNKTGLKWEDLDAIFQDYMQLKEKLEQPTLAIVNILMTKTAKDSGVHSVRYRIKDAHGLIEKIIRKKIDDKIDISLKTYREEVTDLIGIRILHVFKNDWLGIHHFIKNTFVLKGGLAPIHYHARTDDKDFTELCGKNGCSHEIHHKGYRSVHYIVSTQLTKEIHYAEIQVRTIFEEGWSEIDHKIRYSYKKKNAVTPFDSSLKQLNKIAGDADKIGTKVKKLEQKTQERILKKRKD